MVPDVVCEEGDRPECLQHTLRDRAGRPLLAWEPSGRVVLFVLSGKPESPSHEAIWAKAVSTRQESRSQPANRAQLVLASKIGSSCVV